MGLDAAGGSAEGPLQQAGQFAEMKPQLILESVHGSLDGQDDGPATEDHQGQDSSEG